MKFYLYIISFLIVSKNVLDFIAIKIFYTESICYLYDPFKTNIYYVQLCHRTSLNTHWEVNCLNNKTIIFFNGFRWVYFDILGCHKYK